MKTKIIFFFALASLFFFSVNNLFSAEIYVDQSQLKVKETAAATQPAREFTSIISENLVKDPKFDQQTQNDTTLLPWVKSTGNFGPQNFSVCANLSNYATDGLGYQEVGKLAPNTRYTLSAYMRVVSILGDVITTGRLYLAVAPFSGTESGKVLQAQDFLILGKPIEVKASPNQEISWRTYQTVYISGQDKNVGLPLYVVMDGKIEDNKTVNSQTYYKVLISGNTSVNSNNGASNGQTSWDTLSLLVEK